VPSRTWQDRSVVAALVADALGVPLLAELLAWGEEPEARQGTLLNNDQRRENVNGRMIVTGSVRLPADTALLLLDDYTGSGATLKEAARALQKMGGFGGEVVPLTVARVRWRLGARGMV
jgi:ATP-dependent DNA helicase RecQ